MQIHHILIYYNNIYFTLLYYDMILNNIMEVVAQLVRASDCGSEGRGFEPHLPPQFITLI